MGRPPKLTPVADLREKARLKKEAEQARMAELRREEMERRVMADRETEAAEASGPTTLANFPKPAARYFKKDYDAFFAYWDGLADNLKRRATVYVYRKWPVINKRICPQCNSICPDPGHWHAPCVCPNVECGWKGQIFIYAGILAEPTDEDAILRSPHYGSGDYTLKMIDSDAKQDKGEQRGICSVRLTVRDDEYPPCITDLREVVLNDPANQEYVNGLRGRGIRLPGDPEPITQEERMDNKSALEVQGEVIKHLSDKLMNKSDGPPPPPPDATASLNIGVQIMNGVGSLMDKALELGRKSAEAASGPAAPDPIAQLERAGQVIKNLSPAAPATDPAVLELLRRMDQRLELASKPPPAPATNALDAAIEAQQKIERLRNVFSRGDGGPEPVEEKSMLAQLMPYIPMGLALVDRIFTNIAAAKAGVQPPPLTQMPEVIMPTPAAQPQRPQIQAPAQQAQAGEPNVFAELEGPLLRRLADKTPGNGAVFADLMIEMKGRTEYEKIKGMIAANWSMFDSMVKAHPIWPKISRVADQRRWEMFVSEFVNRDSLYAQAQGVADQAANGAPAPPAPVTSSAQQTKPPKLVPKTEPPTQ